MNAELKRNELKLQAMCERLEQGVWWGEQRLRRNIRTSEAQQKQFVFEYLCGSSLVFREWANSNMKLLENDFTPWSIKWAARGIFGWLPAGYSGEIHDNGFAYIQHDRLQVFTLRFQAFPTLVAGSINALGVISLRIVKSTSFPSRATQFLGTVDGEGKLTLHDTERYGWINRHEFIEGWMGDPFAKDEAKRSAFLANKARMKEAMLAFRNELVRDAEEIQQQG